MQHTIIDLKQTPFMAYLINLPVFIYLKQMFWCNNAK